MCSVAQWILFHAILEMPNHWTSLLSKKFLEAHAPALRMCVHSFKDFRIVEVCLYRLNEKLCVCVCVCVSDMVLEVICSCQCLIEQSFMYELSNGET